jgi:hypothetical protein
MWHAGKKYRQGFIGGRNTDSVLLGEDDGKRQFARPRNRRGDNIKLILLK